jgi:hypothetical protein
MSFSVISFEGLTFFFFVNLLGLMNYYYLSITFKTLCKVYWMNDSVIVVVIKVNIDKTFSLDEAANAPDYQRDIHPRGKVVILSTLVAKIQCLSYYHYRPSLKAILESKIMMQILMFHLRILA